jgi:hypothetical protein
MALGFRNIDTSPDDPVQTWPFEGVLTALERAGLSQWRRLAFAISVDPWGQVARYVEQALAISHPFGVTEVMTDIIAQARAGAEESERLEVAATVREVITASGRTQAQFAADIGTSASRLSTYASGKVVPSATMLARMRRAAGTAERGRQQRQ